MSDKTVNAPSPSGVAGVQIADRTCAGGDALKLVMPVETAGAPVRIARPARKPSTRTLARVKSEKGLELPEVAEVAMSKKQDRTSWLTGVYQRIRSWASGIMSALKRASMAAMEWMLSVVERVYGWIQSLSALLGQIVAVFCVNAIRLLHDLVCAVQERALELTTLPEPLG